MRPAVSELAVQDVDFRDASGMEPLIRAVLTKLVGEEDAKDIDIVSNDVNIKPDGSWEIKYRHPTRYELL